MPIPTTKPITPVTPNAIKYDLSISSRISDGKLLVAVMALLTPCRCDEGVWQDCYSQPKPYPIPDLDQFAAENSELAELVANVNSALNALVVAVNAKAGLL